jgi:hypothetical protein
MGEHLKVFCEHQDWACLGHVLSVSTHHLHTTKYDRLGLLQPVSIPRWGGALACNYGVSAGDPRHRLAVSILNALLPLDIGHFIVSATAAAAAAQLHIPFFICFSFFIFSLDYTII